MRISLPILAAVMAMTVTAAWGSPAPPPADPLAWGRSLLSRDCGGCHAIGKRGASAHADAPAFRELSRRYEVEALGEALAEGLVTGHPDMPEFRFAPSEVDAILRYLKSIQTAPRRGR